MRTHLTGVGRSLGALLLLGLAAPAGLGQKKAALDSDMVLAVAMSPDGRLLAGGGFGKDVKVWEARTGKLVHALEGPRRTTRRALAFAPDGQTLAGGGEDGTLHLWNVRTGVRERSFSVSADFEYLRALAYSPEGTRLAVASIKIAFAPAAAGRRLVLATHHWRSEVVVFDVKTGRPRWSWAQPGSVDSVAFAPDGKTLAAADGAVHLLDGETGTRKATWQIEQRQVRTLAFSPDGTLLAGGGGRALARDEGTEPRGEVCWWEVPSGKRRDRPLDLRYWVRALAFAPFGTVLATGSNGPILETRSRSWVSSEIRLWEPSTGRALRTVGGELGGVTSLAFSPDGKSLLSCDGEVVALTETLTGLRRLTFPKGARTPSPAPPLADVQPWSDLASSDGVRAYRAMAELVNTPRDTVGFLGKHLEPSAAVPGPKVDQLVAELGSEQYAVRVRAERELERLQDLAEAALVKALAAGPPLEVRQRAERLLEKLDLLKSPERLRSLRAIEVLENLATTEARQILQRLADGAPAAQQTREARAALARLTRSRER